jgi:hypothetical protein
MRLLTLFSLVAFAFVVNFVDPEKAGAVGKLLFYLTLFFSLSGIFNLLLLGIRKRTMGEDTAVLNVGLSFRQGILLAILFSGLLALQSLRFLTWWDGLLLLVVIFVVELYFLNKQV